MTTARYDPVADWYDAWVGDEARPDSVAAVTARALGHVAGRRVLDLACGTGVAARCLAARGALVEGVDLSPRLIAKAEAAEARHPRGVRYRVGDAAGTGWWDGTPFDAVVGAASPVDFVPERTRRMIVAMDVGQVVLVIR